VELCFLQKLNQVRSLEHKTLNSLSVYTNHNIELQFWSEGEIKKSLGVACTIKTSCKKVGVKALVLSGHPNASIYS
jgi:hypothetical protein